MKTLIFLIITMNYQVTDLNRGFGYGAVSVTPVESLEVCEKLKEKVARQANNPRMVVKCEEITTKA